jgi:hypothetical protein
MSDSQNPTDTNGASHADPLAGYNARAAAALTALISARTRMSISRTHAPSLIWSSSPAGAAGTEATRASTS